MSLYHIQYTSQNTLHIQNVRPNHHHHCAGEVIHSSSQLQLRQLKAQEEEGSDVRNIIIASLFHLDYASIVLFVSISILSPIT